LLEEPGVRAIVLNYHDITERKRAADVLHESEERFKGAFQYSAIGMALVSIGGKWLKANPELCSIIGYSEAELLTKTFQDITHPDDLSTDLNFLKQLLDGEIQSYTMEKRYFHKDGHIVWSLLAVALARDNTGMPLYFISQIRDITDRKQAELEMRQRLSELELLYQSGLVFSQFISPHVIAEKIIDLLDQKMDWHHTTIRIYHPESVTVELLAFHIPALKGSAEYKAAEQRFRAMRFDEGLSGWVVKHGKAVRSNDLRNDPRYFETYSGLQSGLYIPMKIMDRVIGVISIESEEPQAFSESDERLVSTLATQAAIAIDNARLLENLQSSNIELAKAYDATIEGWSRALDLRDKETEGHSRRVTEMTVNLARTFGLSEAELMQVRWGSLLHDIGKMGVPDGILFKTGPLTEEEWTAMKKHPTFAYEMLSPVEHLRLALDIPYCHHEKWDGTGYPRGLHSTQIPLTARIFAVVDVWDALRSDRPYRPAWSEDKVRDHILALSGTHFDPQVVERFLQAVG
jgi:PAS domain S-box-containing protein